MSLIRLRRRTKTVTTDAAPGPIALGPWWDRRVVTFDLETTGTDTRNDRIVSASISWLGGDEPAETWKALADPGIQIPADATAKHGITTAQARAEGRPARDVVVDMICKHRGIRLDNAHDANADSIAAAEVAYQQCESASVEVDDFGRRTPAELASLNAEWRTVRGDLIRLMEAQTKWDRAWRQDFASYLRSQGATAAAVKLEHEQWPLDVR